MVFCPDECRMQGTFIPSPYSRFTALEVLVILHFWYRYLLRGDKKLFLQIFHFSLMVDTQLFFHFLLATAYLSTRLFRSTSPCTCSCKCGAHTFCKCGNL